MDDVVIVIFGILCILIITIIGSILAKNSWNDKPKKQPNYFQIFIEQISGIAISNEDILNAEKKLFKENNNFWDPVETLNIQTIRKNAAEVEVKIENLKKNPGQINKNLSIIFVLGLLICSVIIYLFYISELLFRKNGLNFPFMIISIFASIFMGVRAYYILLTKDLVKLEIAKKKGWIYNPNHDQTKYESLIAYFPETFTKGNQNQYIEDQFWGLTLIGNNYHYFYTGVFYYEIVNGSGKNRKVTPYTTHYFIFPLKKDINARFHLFPENAGSIITNWFTKKEINLESNEFNKTFAFTYDGEKGKKAQEIVKTLTPIMQEKLINLYKQKGGCEILFARTAVVFLFENDILNNIKTDFKKNSEINSDDLKEIDEKLTELIKISEEMSKYLD